MISHLIMLLAISSLAFLANHGGMVELADTADLKSAAVIGIAGSTPAPATTDYLRVLTVEPVVVSEYGSNDRLLWAGSTTKQEETWNASPSKVSGSSLWEYSSSEWVSGERLSNWRTGSDTVEQEQSWTSQKKYSSSRYASLASWSAISPLTLSGDNQESSNPNAAYIWSTDHPPFWLPKEMAEDTYPVVQCESRHDPWATGWAGERGLWQLHPIHAWRFHRMGWTWDDAYDPGKNAAIAIELWRESGYRPWSCAWLEGVVE